MRQLDTPPPGMDCVSNTWRDGTIHTSCF
jgi:hypothetical protein